MKKVKSIVGLLVLLTVVFAVSALVFADGGDAAAAEAAASSSIMGKALGAGIAIAVAAGLGALGMGLATGRAAESMARQPEIKGDIRTNLILGIVFMETAIIYALIVAILIIFVM